MGLFGEKCGWPGRRPINTPPHFSCVISLSIFPPSNLQQVLAIPQETGLPVGRLNALGAFKLAHGAQPSWPKTWAWFSSYITPLLLHPLEASWTFWLHLLFFSL